MAPGLGIESSCKNPGREIGCSGHHQAAELTTTRLGAVAAVQVTRPGCGGLGGRLIGFCRGLDSTQCPSDLECPLTIRSGSPLNQRSHLEPGARLPMGFQGLEVGLFEWKLNRGAGGRAGRRWPQDSTCLWDSGRPPFPSTPLSTAMSVRAATDPNEQAPSGPLLWDALCRSGVRPVVRAAPVMAVTLVGSCNLIVIQVIARATDLPSAAPLLPLSRETGAQR